MAFQRRLIGEDGHFSRGVLGTTVLATTGDATPIAANTWVKIISKAATASIFGDLEVGQFYLSPVEVDGHYISGSDLDSWQVLTLTKFVDGVSWSVEISADEIDVTVNQDKFRKYRRGKLDANGNASFIYISGVTDLPTGLAQKFYDIVQISATGVATVTPANADSIYLVGYLNEGKAVADENVTVATIMKVELFNFMLPSTMGEPGNIDVPFRLVDDNDPVLYTITLPVA